MESLTATPPNARAICHALKQLRESVGLSQKDLAKRTGFPQSYISRWELSRLPKPDDIWHLETAGFGVQPGTTYTLAGFADPVVGVVDAVKADPALNTMGRRAVEAVYQACRIPLPSRIDEDPAGFPPDSDV